jgi:hypothetical protein
MIPAPKISGSEATVRDMKALFENDKVHAVLIVDSGVLLAVVERSDLDQSTSDGRRRCRWDGSRAASSRAITLSRRPIDG